jgi:ankyrin repeat protein
MVDTGDDNGVTPLMYAALEGDSHRVRQLVAQRADLSRQNNHGRTALMFAALCGEL